MGRFPAPIDDGRRLVSALPPHIYPYKLLLRDRIGPRNFAPRLTHRALGTDLPSPMHTFAVLCGNSMTQLFSRLLASHFPHPPGPLRDFKVRKGHSLRFPPWEAEPLSKGDTAMTISFYSPLRSPTVSLQVWICELLICTASDVASDQSRRWCHRRSSSDLTGRRDAAMQPLKFDSKGLV